jgi:hypothetical protein
MRVSEPLAPLVFLIETEKKALIPRQQKFHQHREKYEAW